MSRHWRTVAALAALLVIAGIAAEWFGDGSEKTASAQSCGLVAAYGGIFEVPSGVEVEVSDANRAALLERVHACVVAELTADASGRYHEMAERLSGPDRSAAEQAERNLVEIELAAAIAGTDAIVQQRQVARGLVRGWLEVDDIIKRQDAGVVLMESGYASGGASHRDEVAAYQKTCRDNGVPVPGSFATDRDWTFRENLKSETAIYFFRSDWNDSEVWTYKDAASGGFCVALVRRKADKHEQYVGTICSDISQQKACFFDNVVYDGAVMKRISWEDFQKRDFSELIHPKDGDPCNLCHLGNNPFIVHPNTKLGKVVQSMYATAVPDTQKFEFLGLGGDPSPWTNFDAISQASGGCFSCHGIPQVTSNSKFCAGVIEMAANRTMPPGYWPPQPIDHPPLWPDSKGCFAKELDPFLARYFPSLRKLKSICSGKTEETCEAH